MEDVFLMIMMVGLCILYFEMAGENFWRRWISENLLDFYSCGFFKCELYWCVNFRSVCALFYGVAAW